MKYLVIGSEGFLGKALCGVLQSEQGALLVKVDRLLTDSHHDAARCYRGELTETKELMAIIDREKPDAIFNLAGVARAASRAELFEINCFAPLRLLDALGRYNVSLVLIGSAAEYGLSPEGQQLGENSPLCPVSDYGISKASQTFMALAHAQQHAQPKVIIARIFNMIGQRLSTDYFLGSFARQIARIEVGLQPATLKVGNLESYRDILPVEKVARVLQCLAAKADGGRVYNVCSGLPRKIKDILVQLLENSKVKVEVVTDPGKRVNNEILWSVGQNSATAKYCDLNVPAAEWQQAILATLDWHRGMVANEK